MTLAGDFIEFDAEFETQFIKGFIRVCSANMSVQNISFYGDSRHGYVTDIDKV
jgi:hypothetical protein